MGKEGTGYNGYTNYHTRVFNLWCSNEESSYLHMVETARKFWKEAQPSEYSTKRQNARWNLAKHLEDECKEGVPEGVSGLYLDLLNAAISEINWTEIAHEWLSEYVEEYVEAKSEDESKLYR